MTESDISKNDVPLEASLPEGAVSLESILCTEDLRRRPWRPPDFGMENRALVALASAMADSPRTILQTLAETILDVTQSDSAGLSLLTTDDGGKRFYWPAIAGIWKPHIGGGTPRNFGPCGDVLDRNIPLLFRHFERRYPYLLPVMPPAAECLLVPFYVGRKAVGTIWAITHDDSRKFDAEDERLMSVLGQFASLAYQTLVSIDDLKFQIAEREKAESALRELTDALETRVRVRTEELEQEIAERKRAEEELRRSEAYLAEAQRRFEGILDIAEDAIISVDSNQRIVLFNQGAEKVFGYVAVDVLGRPLDILLPQRFAPVHRGHIEAFAKAPEVSRLMGQRREVFGRRKDSSEFPAEASISKLDLNGEVIFTVILRDITERKRAEEELRRSEAYLAEAQRLSRTGSFGWNVSSGELIWSKETFCILGYDQATKPSLDLVFTRVHPEDFALVQQTMDRASRDGADLDFEHRLLMPDGSVKHVHVVAHAVGDELDALEFVGAVSDVTAARKAEERIRQDEREFRQIVEAIPALILVLAPDGNPLYANERVLEYTGLTLEDFQVGDFRERVFHPSDVERLRDERRQALARGVSFELEQRARRKDGQYRWFIIRYEPLLHDQGHVIRWYATGTDIDDRKQAEERVRNENLALREEIDKASMFEEIVGASPVLQAVLARVAKVAPTDSTVLITGETGTGKELIARAIHRGSPRATRAFVSVNCAAIPPALIASELFGHEKGAFTGAVERRLGRFELAEGGTLFLDEIGELPSETQIALLRVLQEREFERVGGRHAIRADVRVIAAANRDLQAAIAAGAFRSDLFYRLNVFPIEMPPLRDRPEDIPLLVEYFVDRYAKKVGKKFRGVNRKTLELLQAYHWPGNIRELQNVIERSVIVCETETISVDESWLSREGLPPTPIFHKLSKRPMTQEKEMIEAALAETRGRVSGPSGAAAKLGLPPSTLESKIRSLKINKHLFKPV